MLRSHMERLAARWLPAFFHGFAHEIILDIFYVYPFGTSAASTRLWKTLWKLLKTLDLQDLHDPHVLSSQNFFKLFSQK